MDSKFIITHKCRALRPGDFFALSRRSLFIRRFDSYDGVTFSFTLVRSYNKDVNISGSVSTPLYPCYYVCKLRSL